MFFGYDQLSVGTGDVEQNRSRHCVTRRGTTSVAHLSAVHVVLEIDVEGGGFGEWDVCVARGKEVVRYGEVSVCVWRLCIRTNKRESWSTTRFDLKTVI